MSQECKRFEESLLELAYGELAEADAEELRMHATECQKCRDELESILLTRKLAAQLPMDEAGDDLDSAILSAAAEQAVSNATVSNATVSNAAVSNAAVSNATVSNEDEAEARVLGDQRPKIAEKPGALEWLRTLLLRPAFATAALAALIFVFTFFLTEKGLSPVSRDEENFDVPAPISTQQEPVWAEEVVESLKKESPRRELTGEDREKDAWDEKPSADRAAEFERAIEGATGRAESTGSSPDMARGVESKPTGRRSAGKGDFGDFTTLPSQSKAKASKQAESEDGLSDDLDAVLGGSFAQPPPAGSIPASGGGGAALPAPQASPKPSSPEGSGPTTTTDTRNLDYESSPAAEPVLEEAEAPAAANMAQTASDESAAEIESELSNQFEMGVAAYSRGDCNTAVAHFNQVIKESSIYASNRAYAMHHIAKCDKRRGRFASAEAWYDKLLILYPGYNRRAEALFESAKCLRRLGQLNRARKRLNELADIPTWTDRAKKELNGLSE